MKIFYSIIKIINHFQPSQTKTIAMCKTHNQIEYTCVGNVKCVNFINKMVEHKESTID